MNDCLYYCLQHYTKDVVEVFRSASHFCLSWISIQKHCTELIPQPLQPLNKHQITHLYLYTAILTHNLLMLTQIRIC